MVVVWDRGVRKSPPPKSRVTRWRVDSGGGRRHRIEQRLLETQGKGFRPPHGGRRSARTKYSRTLPLLTLLSESDGRTGGCDERHGPCARALGDTATVEEGTASTDRGARRHHPIRTARSPQRQAERMPIRHLYETPSKTSRVSAGRQCAWQATPRAQKLAWPSSQQKITPAMHRPQLCRQTPIYRYTDSARPPSLLLAYPT